MSPLPLFLPPFSILPPSTHGWKARPHESPFCFGPRHSVFAPRLKFKPRAWLACLLAFLWQQTGEYMHGYCRTEKIEESRTLFFSFCFHRRTPSFFRRTNAWFEVLSPDCVAAVNFRKLSCQEEIHGRKGLNKHQVKPSWAELSKKESKKNISTEKNCFNKKMEWDNNCASIHIFFRRHLHKYLPF